jgi:hypothetical protein
MFQKKNRDMASKIICSPRGENGNHDRSLSSAKPPSLAGVEKFIRAKVVGAAAGSAAPNVEGL